MVLHSRQPHTLAGRTGAISMGQEQRRAAKLRVIGGMQRGVAWREAAKAADAYLSRATAFRALRIVRSQGEEALEDRRHGRPHKLTAPVHEWLAEYCRGAPGTSSRMVRAQIEELFGTTVNISQINRARAALGVSSNSRGSGGKSPVFTE